MTKAIKIPAFVRMNLDVDVRGLKPGEYRRLVNGIPISPLGTEGLDGVISNIVGNEQVANASLQATSTVIGFLEDPAKNRCFFFVYHSGGNHTIYQYDGSVIVIVLRTSLFAWTALSIISADIYGDTLLVTDNTNEIKKINVVKAIAGGVYTPVLEQITLMKRPPMQKTTPMGVFESTRVNNNVAGHYFQFYHRYVYEDNEPSVFGPASFTIAWAQPTFTVKAATRTNTTLSGEQTVDGYVGAAGDRILLMDQTAPDENGIWVMQVGAWNRPTDADTAAEVNTVVAFVQFGFTFGAKIYRMTTTVVTLGTDPIYFELLTGPNKITVTVPTSEIPSTVASIEFAVKIDGSNEMIVYRIERSAFSASHSFYNDTFLYTVPDSEAVVWNHSVPLTSKALKVHRNRLFLLNNTEGYAHKPSGAVALSITNIANNDAGAVSCFKGGATYNVGVMFFGYGARHSGVCLESSITVPYVNQYRYFLTHTIQYKGITADLSAIAQADIPTWATQYSIVRTNATNKSFFLSYAATDIFYFKRDADGVATYQKTSSGADGVAVLIKSFPNEKIGYTFQKGDRLKMFYETVEDLSVDVEIQSQEGGFIYLPMIQDLVGVITSGGAAEAAIEIYTPIGNTLEPFFEVGIRYDISNPGGGARAFSTTSIALPGDVYAIQRDIYTDTGSYSDTDPFANEYVKRDAVSHTYFEAMNIYNENFNKWVRGVGRSTVKDPNGSLQMIKTNALRWGQKFSINSSLEAYNVFYALDEYNLQVNNGIGQALKSAGDVLNASFSAENVSIYVGEGFVSTADGQEFLAKTDNVIGDDRKNLGSHGTVNPQTVIENNGRVYYLDLTRGCVIRKSQDGLTVISDYGMRTYISIFCLIYKTISASNQRIVAGWDPKYRCYVLSFQNLLDPTANNNATFYFHEDTNSWVCEAQYLPEFLGQLGTIQLQFSGGHLWRQTNNITFNNWFGVQKYRATNIEIGADSEEKIWTGIEVDTDSIYTPATPSTLLKITAPNSTWTETSSSPDATLGATTISRTGTGVCSATQPLVIPPGGTVKFSVKISFTVAAASPTGGQLTVRLNSAVPTSVVYTTAALAAGANEFVIPVEIVNLDSVNTTTLELLAQPIEAVSAAIVITLPVGAVMYETLSSNEDVILLYHVKDGTLQTRINFRDFRLRGSAWRSSFFRSLNDPNFGSTTESKYKSSQKVRGQSAYITVNGRSTGLNPMKSITVFYEPSQLSYP